MKTFTSCILAALFAANIQAVRLGETQIVKIIPDEYDMPTLGGGEAQGKDLVDVAMPLIQHVLEKEDDDTVKKIVRDILDKETKEEEEKIEKAKKPVKVLKAAQPIEEEEEEEEEEGEEEKEDDDDDDGTKVVVILVNDDSDDEDVVQLVE